MSISSYFLFYMQCVYIGMGPKVMKGFVSYSFTSFLGKVENKSMLMSFWNTPELTNAEMVLFLFFPSRL